MAELKWNNMGDAGANSALANLQAGLKTQAIHANTLGEAFTNLIDKSEERFNKARDEAKDRNAQLLISQMNNANSLEDIQKIQASLNEQLGVFGSNIDLSKYNASRKSWEVDVESRNSARDALRDTTPAAQARLQEIQSLINRGDRAGAEKLLANSSNIFSTKTAKDLASSIREGQIADRNYALEAMQATAKAELDKENRKKAQLENEVLQATQQDRIQQAKMESQLNLTNSIRQAISSSQSDFNQVFGVHVDALNTATEIAQSEELLRQEAYEHGSQILNNVSAENQDEAKLLLKMILSGSREHIGKLFQLTSFNDKYEQAEYFKVLSNIATGSLLVQQKKVSLSKKANSADTVGASNVQGTKSVATNANVESTVGASNQQQIKNTSKVAISNETGTTEENGGNEGNSQSKLTSVDKKQDFSITANGVTYSINTSLNSKEKTTSIKNIIAKDSSISEPIAQKAVELGIKDTDAINLLKDKSEEEQIKLLNNVQSQIDLHKDTVSQVADQSKSLMEDSKPTRSEVSLSDTVESLQQDFSKINGTVSEEDRETLARLEQQRKDAELQKNQEQQDLTPINSYVQQTIDGVTHVNNNFGNEVEKSLNESNSNGQKVDSNSTRDSIIARNNELISLSMTKDASGRVVFSTSGLDKKELELKEQLKNTSDIQERVAINTQLGEVRAVKSRIIDLEKRGINASTIMEMTEKIQDSFLSTMRGNTTSELLNAGLSSNSVKKVSSKMQDSETGVDLYTLKIPEGHEEEMQKARVWYNNGVKTNFNEDGTLWMDTAFVDLLQTAKRNFTSFEDLPKEIQYLIYKYKSLIGYDAREDFSNKYAPLVRDYQLNLENSKQRESLVKGMNHIRDKYSSITTTVGNMDSMTVMSILTNPNFNKYVKNGEIPLNNSEQVMNAVQGFIGKTYDTNQTNEKVIMSNKELGIVYKGISTVDTDLSKKINSLNSEYNNIEQKLLTHSNMEYGNGNGNVSSDYNAESITRLGELKEQAGELRAELAREKETVTSLLTQLKYSDFDKLTKKDLEDMSKQYPALYKKVKSLKDLDKKLRI